MAARDGAELLGHNIVENPILDTVAFCGTAILWCFDLNPVVVRYGTNHKYKVRRYATLV